MERNPKSVENRIESKEAAENRERFERGRKEYGYYGYVYEWYKELV